MKKPVSKFFGFLIYFLLLVIFLNIFSVFFWPKKSLAQVPLPGPESPSTPPIVGPAPGSGASGTTVTGGGGSGEDCVEYCGGGSAPSWLARALGTISPGIGLGLAAGRLLSPIINIQCYVSCWIGTIVFRFYHLVFGLLQTFFNTDSF